MQRRVLVPVLIVSASIVAACGEDQSAQPVPPAEQPTTPTTQPPVAAPGELIPLSDDMYDLGAALVADFVGLPLVDFEAAVVGLGYGPVRTVAIDGEGLDVTADLVDGRVDVAVVTRDGVQVVVDAAVEVLAPEPGVVEVVDVARGVSFYPACGDEVLEHEGVRWYQVHESDEPDRWAAIFAVERAEPTTPDGFGGLARVMEPGPGDDTGTLVIWADGVARFVSDSGDLTAWMVTDEITYDWVC